MPLAQMHLGRYTSDGAEYISNVPLAFLLQNYQAGTYWFLCFRSGFLRRLALCVTDLSSRAGSFFQPKAKISSVHFEWIPLVTGAEINPCIPKLFVLG
jgi:hypothetical protein